MKHIDDFISDLKSDAYAAFIFNQFRLPAILRCRFDKVMRERGLLLFCTYEGKRWRVTGASRMGDVWLSADFGREMGYELRVDVDACSEWSATPNCPDPSCDWCVHHAPDGVCTCNKKQALVSPTKER